MSAALLQPHPAENCADALQVTFGNRPRIVVLPGKWQRLVAAILIDADYTVVAGNDCAGLSGLQINPDPARHLPDAIAYTPEDPAGFLRRVAERAESVNRFAHIVSL